MFYMEYRQWAFLWLLIVVEFFRRLRISVWILLLANISNKGLLFYLDNSATNRILCILQLVIDDILKISTVITLVI